MKTLSRYLYLFSFTLLISACGGGKGGPNSNAGSGGSSGSNGSIPNIDSSKPLMEQFQQIFSNLKPGSDFYGVKIKSVTHPKKFVGTWSAWTNQTSIKITYNADGTCGEEHNYHNYTPDKTTFDCRQWFHITLQDSNTPFLFTVFKNQYDMLSYEWNDNNNIYLKNYTNGGVLLATRTTSSPIAANIDARPLFGTWAERHYPYSRTIPKFDSYWKFDAPNQFTISGYDADTREQLFNEKGTWDLSNETLSIQVPALGSSTTETALSIAAPAAKIDLNFLHGNDSLTLSRGRVAEPIMVKGDPFVGRFQGSYGGYIDPFTFSFNIRKEADHYKLDMYLNDEVYRDIKATKTASGLLNFNTNKGEMSLRASVNGLHIHKGLKLLSYGHSLNIRVNRVSQNTSALPASIIGKWMRWSDDEDHQVQPRNEFTFFENGTFKFKNLYYVAGYGIRRTEGTYRIEGKNKIYFKAFCQKEDQFTAFNLNNEHLSFDEDLYNFSVIPSATYGRVPNGAPLTKFWGALYKHEGENKVKLKPHPTQKGKFTFAESKKYMWLDIDVGANAYSFTPTGIARNTITVGRYDGGYNSQTFRHGYYVEAEKGKQEVIVIYDGSKINEVLPLYNTRQSLCVSNSYELILEK